MVQPNHILFSETRRRLAARERARPRCQRRNRRVRGGFRGEEEGLRLPESGSGQRLPFRGERHCGVQGNLHHGKRGSGAARTPETCRLCIISSRKQSL